MRTKVGNFVHSVWTSLNLRCVNGKYHHLRTISKCLVYEDIMIEFTRDEFKKYCIDNLLLIESLDRPSLDRIDNSLGYSLCNIQIIELRDNIRKSKLKAKDGKSTCCRCGEEKDLDLFSKDRRLISGYTNKCKKCDNLRRKSTRGK